jgi:hypothetical protein
MDFGWYDGKQSLVATCTSFDKNGNYFTACTYGGLIWSTSSVKVGDLVSLGRGSYQKLESIEDQGLTWRFNPKVYYEASDDNDYKGNIDYGKTIDQRFRIDHAGIRAYNEWLDSKASMDKKRQEIVQKLEVIEKEEAEDSEDGGRKEDRVFNAGGRAL